MIPRKERFLEFTSAGVSRSPETDWVLRCMITATDPDDWGRTHRIPRIG